MQRASGTAGEEEPVLPREADGFRILRQLGRGGMGVVYEAEEIASGRIVALKVLARELSVSEEAFGRFQREARLAGAISDGNCVFVYGAHRIEGSPAISMELCGGETLDERIKRKEPIPVETAVRWAIEMIDGLEAAHEVGVVHRDVKPSNCFLTADGHLKVGDFGLARTLEPDVALTQSGSFLGSPLYASPEQVRGRQLDLRSDMYSAAATLYALLTGRSPYVGTNIGEVLARILSEPPPPLRSVRPEIPPGLEKVVLKAMSREPAKRYKTYAAFREALAPFAESALQPGRRGLRVMSFLVDSWLIGVATSPLMMLGGMQLLDAERPWTFENPWVGIAHGVFPFLYFGLCEGLFGATPARWLFGQRVVAVRAVHPVLWRALVRAALFQLTLVPRYLILDRVFFLDTFSGPLVASALGIGLYLALMITARKGNGWRGVHELLSGTRTIQRAAPFRRFRPSEAPPLETPVRVEIGVPQAIGTLTVEGVVGRTPFGRVLRGRDPELERSVWIHEREAEAQAAGVELRREDRRGRLRWLASVAGGRWTYDVYEDPGGVGLTALRRTAGPVPWSAARRQIVALADALAELESEGEHVSLERLWVDRSWNVRLLDAPIGPQAGAPLAPADALAGAVRALLGDALPADLPVHAEPAVRKLLGQDPPYGSVREAREALALWDGKPAAVGRTSRVTQAILAAAFPAFGGGFALVIAAVTAFMLAEAGMGLALLKKIELAEQADRQQGGEPTVPSGELREAYLTAISASLGGTWGHLMTRQFEGRTAELYREARERHPSPSPEEIALAEERLKQAGVELPEFFGKSWMIGSATATLVLGMVAAVWLAFALVLSVALKGGLSFRMTGIRIRTLRGPLASRVRCLLRTLVAATPAFALIASAALAMALEAYPVAGVFAAIAPLVALGGAIYAAVGKGPSLQDRIAGTRLVPR